MGTGLLQFWGLFVFLRYYLGPSQVVTVGVTVLLWCLLAVHKPLSVIWIDLMALCVSLPAPPVPQNLAVPSFKCFPFSSFIL